MRRIKPAKPLYFIMLFWISIPAVQLFSQKPEDKASFDKKSIIGQFDYIFEKSSLYEDYRVIKIPWLYTFKSHLADTIKGFRKEINDNINVLSVKAKEIDSLKADLSSTNEKLDVALKEKNSLTFIGIKLEKGSYNSIMWTVVGALSFFLLSFIILFKRSTSIASQTKQNLLEVKEEFETHRKKALEREEKLARRHLDELNKYKGDSDSIRRSSK